MTTRPKRIALWLHAADDTDRARIEAIIRQVEAAMSKRAGVALTRGQAIRLALELSASGAPVVQTPPPEPSGR